ncbi:hypothetical protein [Bradyrhizobium sp.]
MARTQNVAFQKANVENSELFRPLAGHLLQAWVDIRFARLALAQLLGGKIAGANEFASPPCDVADADNGSMAVEGDAEYFRNGERADFNAEAAGGHVDNKALKPRRVRCGNDEAWPPILNPFMPSVAEILGVSYESSIVGIVWQYLARRLENLLTIGDREPGNS